MKRKRIKNSVDAFEEALSNAKQEHYELCLYVTGATPKSTLAIANVKAICEEYLKGRYTLSVIDIYQQPAQAEDEQILATPTLIKKRPPPIRRLVGDMSDKERVLAGLDLRK
jgi:circadian clock protein KaiB